MQFLITQNAACVDQLAEDAAFRTVGSRVGYVRNVGHDMILDNRSDVTKIDFKEISQSNDSLNLRPDESALKQDEARKRQQINFGHDVSVDSVFPLTQKLFHAVDLLTENG